MDPVNEKIKEQIEKNVTLHKEITNMEKEIETLEKLKKKPQ